MSDIEKLASMPFAPTEDLWVSLAAPLGCVCPVNGLEDRAMVRVDYRPSAWVVELGSFKAYLDSFVGDAILHEAVAERIQTDLRELLEPDDLTVAIEWAPVEGVNCTVRTTVR